MAVCEGVWGFVCMCVIGEEVDVDVCKWGRCTRVCEYVCV